MPDSINLFGSIGGGMVTRSDQKTGKITVTSEVSATVLRGIEDVRDARLKRIEDKVEKITKRLSALAEFKEKLTILHKNALHLQTRPDNLTLGAFASLDASGYGTRLDGERVSDIGQIIEGNISPDAAIKSFALEVIQKASCHLINAEVSVADQSAENGAAFTLQLKTDGEHYTDIDILATDSLQTIQNKINARANTTDINAYIVNIGGEYRLSMQANETGKVMYIKAETGNLPPYIPEQANEDLVAGDKDDDDANTVGILGQFSFNGIIGTTPTNTISPAQGVTLTFKKAEQGSIYHIDLKPDKGKILEQFAIFEKTYNEVIAFTKQHSQVGEDGEILEGSELYGSRILDTIRFQVPQLLLRAKDDLNGKDFRQLEDIGMSRDLVTQEIKFDLDKISTLIDKDFAKFKRLFEFSSTTTNDKIGLVNRPASIPQALISENGMPVTALVQVAKYDSDYTATITFDRGPFAGSIYTIEGELKGASAYIYFEGAKAKKDGIATKDLNNLEYFAHDSGGAFPMEAGITLNNGTMHLFSQSLKDILQSETGDFEFSLKESLSEQDKLAQQSDRIKEQSARKIARTSEKLTRMQEKLAALEGIQKQAKAVANIDRKD